jgi:hypothetical protein
MKRLEENLLIAKHLQSPSPQGEGLSGGSFLFVFIFIFLILLGFLLLFLGRLLLTHGGIFSFG